VKLNSRLAMVILAMIFPGLILLNGCSSPEIKTESGAVIVDQLYSLEPNQDVVETMTSDLQKNGYKVDYFKGDQITVDFYRKLPSMGYKLIIFRAHAGILGSGGEMIKKTCLFTYEPYSESKYITEQLSDKLAKARTDTDHPWLFGIGSDFVKDSMQGKFDRTVIIMMGCSTLYIEDLAKSFINKGASIYLGWNATVGLNYVDQVTPAFLTRILSNDSSIEAAVTDTLKEKGIDPDFGATLNYYPQSNKNKTLSELLSPPETIRK
jgi:hypothetical protein